MFRTLRTWVRCIFEIANFATGILIASFGVHNIEDIRLVMILKYILPQMTLALNLHIINQKTVAVLFQHIKENNWKNRRP
jgi:hypothetical protein